MVFSSAIFVFIFLPIVLFIHSLLYLYLRSRPSCKILNICIFIASILFYSWGEPKYILLLLISTLCNFYFAILVGSSESQKKRNGFLAAGISINILLLAYFKYAGFFLEILQVTKTDSLILRVWDPDFLSRVTLPIGISFYTFQGLSYLIDVHRRIVPASTRFTDFGCYLTMFSQLIAGPIVRYASIASQLARRTLTLESMWSGATRFIFGLAKKILIADTLGRVADAAFDVPGGELPASAAWLGITCYFFQIYYDFSGYSDMAIGMGRMMGFTLPENFRYPYMSRSIREFWRRWHITLSSWFRDYLYIPLGGNRKGRYRTAFNLLVVFALCGLWHGATFGFLAWGLYHGFFLAIERVFPRFTDRMPRFLQHVYATCVVMIGWVLFRAEHMSNAAVYLKAMFGSTPVKSFAHNNVWFHANGYTLPLALSIAVILSMPVYPYIQKKVDRFCLSHKALPVTFLILVKNCWVLALFFFSLLPLFGATYKAFIYFRF